MTKNFGTVRFAFYKPAWNDIFGQVIAWYTRLFNWGSKNYAHVEIGLKINGEWAYFSADNKEGCRWISPAKLFVDPKRWDVIEVYAQRPYLDMIETAERLKGMRYDWWGLAGFVEPIQLYDDKNKRYCSEACEEVFSGVWMQRISPERLQTSVVQFKV